MITAVTGVLNGPVPAVERPAATWILYTVNSVSPVRREESAVVTISELLPALGP